MNIKTKVGTAVLAGLLYCGAGGQPGTSAWAGEPAPALVYQVPEGQELDAETKENIDSFLSGLSPQYGEIILPQTNATLNIPKNYYFLGAENAQSVLENAWGNPPDDTVLGMIFPAGKTPLDSGVWGATISYSGDGYVSDKDAEKINYDKLLKDLQKNARDANAWRTQNGYDTIEIVGWAEPPTYNSVTNKMYWAKELDFGGSETNTLNYDIRVLGRRGTMVISFVSDIDQLAEIRGVAPDVLQMASFNAGSTYADYRPGVDQKAAYGLAGLVGGAALAKKTGLLAAILIFGKKFIVFIIAGIVAAFGGIKRMFSRGGGGNA